VGKFHQKNKIMARTEWTGKDLNNLLNASKEKLLALYPDYDWATLRRTKNKKLAAIKAGKLVDKGVSSEYTATDDVVPADVGEQAEQIVELKRLLKMSQRKQDEAREGKLEYVATLRAAFEEATADIKLNIPTANRVDVKTKGAEEIAVVTISDLQLGKVTTTYNMEVCAERMKTLAEKVIKIASIQNTDHPVKKLHIQLLGDIVEGEDIFPNQAYQIAAGNYRQLNYGWGILVQFILDMLTYFDNIHVVGVVGNHGRISSRGGNIDPETNMDRMLYDRLRGQFHSPLFDEPRVTFNVPEGTGLRSWYAVDRIYGWGFLLCHGDQINGWAGIPFYGTQKKALGWIDAIDEPWDYLMMGHFHTPTMLTYGKRKAYFNGSTESSNEFAQEKIASIGYPTQNMFFVNPTNGITAQYEIKLEDTLSNLERAKRVAKHYGNYKVGDKDYLGELQRTSV
jgi:hypothetical protein